MLARFSGFVMKSQMSCDESYSWSGMFLDVSFLRVKCLTVCFLVFPICSIIFAGHVREHVRVRVRVRVRERCS